MSGMIITHYVVSVKYYKNCDKFHLNFPDMYCWRWCWWRTGCHWYHYWRLRDWTTRNPGLERRQPANRWEKSKCRRKVGTKVPICCANSKKKGVYQNFPKLRVQSTKCKKLLRRDHLHYQKKYCMNTSCLANTLRAS